MITSWHQKSFELQWLSSISQYSQSFPKVFPGLEIFFALPPDILQNFYDQNLEHEPCCTSIQASMKPKNLHNIHWQPIYYARYWNIQNSANLYIYIYFSKNNHLHTFLIMMIWVKIISHLLSSMFFFFNIVLKILSHNDIKHRIKFMTNYFLTILRKWKKRTFFSP